MTMEMGGEQIPQKLIARVRSGGRSAGGGHSTLSG